MVYKWEPGTEYTVGSTVSYESHLYCVVQTHQAQADWAPPIVPALFKRIPEIDSGPPQDDGTHQHAQEIPHDSGESVKHEEQQPMPASTPEVEGKTHHSWLNLSPHQQHQLEAGGGLVAGLAALGAGYYAYHHHEKSEEEEKAHAFALSNWLKEAAARRDDYHKNGPSGPVTWILNEGHAIPPNAIQGGYVDGKSLYICRAYYEGGVHPGVCSPSLEKGAVIGYGNKEIQVGTYEVLVGDGRAIRWVSVHGSVDIANLGDGEFGYPFTPVQGGHESNGAQLLIAQGAIGDGVYPGKVGEGFKGALVPLGNREKECKEYKVLCYT